MTSDGPNQLAWQVFYRDPAGVKALVEDVSGLTRHLQQRRGYAGDLTAAISRFAERSQIRRAPITLVAGLIEGSNQGLQKARPRKLLGKPSPDGDGTGRADFSRPVFEECESMCAYCGRRSEPGGTFYSIGVDPIIPLRMVRRGYREDWIEDMANLVPCCTGGVCARIGNSLRLDEPAPTTMDGFFDLRDRVFVQRRARVALGVPVPGGDSTGAPVGRARR